MATPADPRQSSLSSNTQPPRLFGGVSGLRSYRGMEHGQVAIVAVSGEEPYLLVYLTDSTETDDDGVTTVKPSNVDTLDPGRWVRANEAPVNSDLGDIDASYVDNVLSSGYRSLDITYTGFTTTYGLTPVSHSIEDNLIDCLPEATDGQVIRLRNLSDEYPIYLRTIASPPSGYDSFSPCQDSHVVRIGPLETISLRFEDGTWHYLTLPGPAPFVFQDHCVARYNSIIFQEPYGIGGGSATDGSSVTYGNSPGVQLIQVTSAGSRAHKNAPSTTYFSFGAFGYYFRARVYISAIAASHAITSRSGFVNAVSVGPSRSAHFEWTIDTGGTLTLQSVSKNSGGTETNTFSGITTNSWVNLEIWVAKDGTDVLFVVNNTQFFIHNTRIPSSSDSLGLMGGFIYADTAPDSTAKILGLDYIEFRTY